MYSKINIMEHDYLFPADEMAYINKLASKYYNPVADKIMFELRRWAQHRAFSQENLVSIKLDADSIVSGSKILDEILVFQTKNNEFIEIRTAANRRFSDDPRDVFSYLTKGSLNLLILNEEAGRQAALEKFENIYAHVNEKSSPEIRAAMSAIRPALLNAFSTASAVVFNENEPLAFKFIVRDLDNPANDAHIGVQFLNKNKLSQLTKPEGSNATEG